MENDDKPFENSFTKTKSSIDLSNLLNTLHIQLSELQSLRTENTKLISEKMKIYHEKIEIEMNVQTLKQQNNDLQTQLQTAFSTINNFELKTYQHRKSYATHLIDLESMKQGTERLNNTILELQKKISALNEENLQLSEKNRIMKSNIKDLSDKEAKAWEGMETLNGYLQKLEYNQKYLENLLDNTNKELTQSEGNITFYKSELENEKMESQKLKAELITQTSVKECNCNVFNEHNKHMQTIQDRFEEFKKLLEIERNKNTLMTQTIEKSIEFQNKLQLELVKYKNKEILKIDNETQTQLN